MSGSFGLAGGWPDGGGSLERASSWAVVWRGIDVTDYGMRGPWADCSKRMGTRRRSVIRSS